MVTRTRVEQDASRTCLPGSFSVHDVIQSATTCQRKLVRWRRRPELAEEPMLHTRWVLGLLVTTPPPPSSFSPLSSASPAVRRECTDARTLGGVSVHSSSVPFRRRCDLSAPTACVIHGVMRHWVIASIADVRVVSE